MIGKIIATISLTATALTALTCSNLANAEAFDQLAVTAKIGTLGFGIEATTPLTDQVNLRGGFNHWSKDDDDVKDDINYQINADLTTFGLMADWHPFNNGFRASAGLYINNSDLSMDADSSASYTIGDTVYTAAEVGKLRGSIDFNTIAPYLGIGWGNALSSQGDLRFNADLGVLFQGNLDVELSATGTLASDPTFASDIAKEEEALQDDADDFELWPVISIGVSYSF